MADADGSGPVATPYRYGLWRGSYTGASSRARTGSRARSSSRARTGSRARSSSRAQTGSCARTSSRAQTGSCAQTRAKDAEVHLSPATPAILCCDYR
ncbi:MAG: hypothetical protein QGH66_05200 [Dehalococcoidia bacterium]|jgi:hypothetical protein|nr:hypothetical protein [Dehalococcoidia bacterium]